MKEVLLKDKKGIIFGALNDKSIAWQVALKAYEHGACHRLEMQQQKSAPTIV